MYHNFCLILRLLFKKKSMQILTCYFIHSYGGQCIFSLHGYKTGNGNNDDKHIFCVCVKLKILTHSEFASAGSASCKPVTAQAYARRRRQCRFVHTFFTLTERERGSIYRMQRNVERNRSNLSSSIETLRQKSIYTKTRSTAECTIDGMLVGLGYVSDAGCVCKSINCNAGSVGLWKRGLM